MHNRNSRSFRLLAPVVALGLAACTAGTDASRISAPSAPHRLLNTASVGDAGDRLPNQGELEICKAGDAGSFEVTPEGGATVTVNLAAGECVVAWIDRGPGADTLVVTVTELPSLTSTLTSVTKTTIYNEYVWPTGPLPDVIDAPVVTTNATVTVKLNEYIGSLVEFVNTLNPPPPAGCTYTKGWYRNNGSNTIIAVDGRTIGQQQQIFAATPGKPGSVTWGANNNNLNLYQQLLAALNNLDGNATAGPAAVDAAIAAAQTATGGSGTAITVAAGTDVSGLIAVLSAFNEGQLAGWPHCDD